MISRSFEGEVTRSISASQSVGERVTLSAGNSVIVGLPPQKGWDSLYGGHELHMPTTPHIFMVSELRIGPNVVMNNVVVLAAHGKRTDDNEWRFSNNSLVIPTVLDYNQIASAQNLPQIQAVLVCNNGNGLETANRSSELAEQGIIFPLSGAIYPHLTMQGGRVLLLVSLESKYTFANV